MTGADRAWAAQYREGDVIRYTKGSAQHAIKPGEYATVREVNVRQNTLKVETKDGREVQYDPKRLRGVSVYERTERSFSAGDRVQLTAPDRSSGLANREMGKIERIDSSGNIDIRADSGRTATIRGEHKHLDHGYAVTSHSAQGTSADRVIVHAESGQSSALVNERFAYVAGSRMRDGLDIYTDDASRLESSMSRQFDKSAALNERTTDQAQSHRGVGAAQNTNAPAQHSQSHEGVRQELGHAR
jgi:ATP-dependent exoDNAse (exonuclease V) alpha subunit